MRERIARTVSALAVGAVMILSLVFARGQNAAEKREAPIDAAVATPPSAVPAPPSDAVPALAADSARGHAVFLAQGCTRCHSVAGAGSPRVPLDGVGARRSVAELRAWTTGAEALADSLSPATLRTKRGYATLPAADLDALVAFLGALKTPR